MAVIHVVEDESLVRGYLGDMLSEAGQQVIEAENADEAIALLETRRDIHIIFTDINMPGSMDGVRLAAVVRDAGRRSGLSSPRAPRAFTNASPVRFSPPSGGTLIPTRRPRQGDPVENLADQQMSLRRGQVLADDRIVETQPEHRARIPGRLEFDHDPLDSGDVSCRHEASRERAARPREQNRAKNEAGQDESTARRPPQRAGPARRWRWSVRIPALRAAFAPAGPARALRITLRRIPSKANIEER
ncbi:MAG TPA: response regulator [Roseiarcus sp.]